MSVSYEVGNGEDDTVIVIEAGDYVEDVQGVRVSVTDHENPTMSVRLELAEVIELRDVLGRVEETLNPVDLKQPAPR